MVEIHLRHQIWLTLRLFSRSSEFLDFCTQRLYQISWKSDTRFSRRKWGHRHTRTNVVYTYVVLCALRNERSKCTITSSLDSHVSTVYHREVILGLRPLMKCWRVGWGGGRFDDLTALTENCRRLRCDDQQPGTQLQEFCWQNCLHLQGRRITGEKRSALIWSLHFCTYNLEVVYYQNERRYIYKTVILLGTTLARSLTFKQGSDQAPHCRLPFHLHTIYTVQQTSKSCNFLHSPALSFHIFVTFHIRRKAVVIVTHATFCFGKSEAKRLMGRSPEILHKSHPRRTRRSSLLSSPHLSPPSPHPTGQPRASRENRQPTVRAT